MPGAVPVVFPSTVRGNGDCPGGAGGRWRRCSSGNRATCACARSGRLRGRAGCAAVAIQPGNWNGALLHACVRCKPTGTLEQAPPLTHTQGGACLVRCATRAAISYRVRCKPTDTAVIAASQAHARLLGRVCVQPPDIVRAGCMPCVCARAQAPATSQPSTAPPSSSSGGCAGATSTSGRTTGLVEAPNPWQLADAHHRGQVQRRAAEEWQAARHDPGGEDDDSAMMDTDDATGISSLSSGMAALGLPRWQQHGLQHQNAEAPAGAPPPGAGAAPLDECGRAAYAQCALADGSSYVCGACRGVVQRTRARQHDALWCPAKHHLAAL